MLIRRLVHTSSATGGWKGKMLLVYSTNQKQFDFTLQVHVHVNANLNETTLLAETTRDKG